MGLESAEYIFDLVDTNPLGSDDARTVDDQIRLTKKAIRQSFPNINAAVTASPADLNIIDGLAANNVSSAELGRLDGVTSNIQIQIDGKADTVHTHATTDITSGVMADARIAASNVTQHQAAIDHNQLINYTALRHVPWSIAGAETIEDTRLQASAITQHESSINHDNLAGYNADEHFDHTAISMFGGKFMSGGGTITTNRNLNFDFAGETLDASSFVDDDEFVVDSVANGLVRKTYSNLLDDILPEATAAAMNKTLVTLGAVANYAADNTAQIIVAGYNPAGTLITLLTGNFDVGDELVIINGNNDPISLAASSAFMLGTTTLNTVYTRTVITKVSANTFISA